MKLKPFLPYVTAFLLFLTITIIQFRPLFSGKVIDQSDIVQYKGASKEISDYRSAEHREPLWTNSMFGGMPTFQISTLYPGNWMGHISKVFHLFLPPPAGYIFMCFSGFFILLLCLEVNPWLALAGSLAFGFSSYFYIILEVGHNSKAHAIAYLAPALGGIILLMRGKFRAGLLLTSLFMALEWNANHLQITYYGLLLFCLVLCSYFIRALRKKELRSYFMGLGIFLGALFISILPNAANLLCTWEYGKYTTRGSTELTIDATGRSNSGDLTSGLTKNYAVQYSYGVSETFSFLIPDFKGGGSGDQILLHKQALEKTDPGMRPLVGQFGAYFGPQEYSAGPSYIGAVVLLFAFLGLLVVDHPLKWPLLIASCLAIMLAWGKYFMPLSSFFLDYFPGYNKFRAVSIINVIAELCIPILAVLALDKLMKAKDDAAIKLPFGKKAGLKKTMSISFAVVGGFCLLCYLLPDTVNTFTTENEQERIMGSFMNGGYSKAAVEELMPRFMDNLAAARKEIFTSDALRSFLFISLVFSLSWLFMIRKINSRIFLLGLGITLCADLWPVAKRYLNDRSFVAKSSFAVIPMSRADEEILQDKSPGYRVLNIAASPFQEAVTSYYHRSIGGYHGAKLKKYDELIQFHLFREIQHLAQNLPAARTDSLRKKLFSELPVLNMLNTKYIICPTQAEPIPLQNTESNGSAWFVKRVQTVKDADTEIMALKELDTKQGCVIRQKNKTELKTNYTAEGTIQLRSYAPNRLVYESDAATNQFAVFAEIFYPEGWNVQINGSPADYSCVNYLLRGMEVPAGKHRIEFTFEPQIYRSGNAVSYIGSVVLLLLCAGGWFRMKRKV